MPEKLIVPNQMTEKELVKLGFPKDKIIVLPWGLSLAKYESQQFPIPTLSSPSSNEDTIVYAGPLHPLRFSTQFLYAFSKVLKQNTSTRLLLLLRKDLWHQRTFEELKSIIRKLELENKVSIIMSTSHETYLSHVARASVVLLPYFSSGMVEVPPFTLLECMALSKPVITSSGIVTSNIVENGINGFTIPKNHSSLADLINLLISDKRMARQIGQNARMAVREKYDLTSFSSKLSNVLESCS
jgi:glycosyltransferase involved in cell wall biosynthesis